VSTPRKAAKPTARRGTTPKAPSGKASTTPLERGGPEARTEAMRLLAEGFTLTSVAGSLGVDRGTVREWRDSPAGRAELTEARKARAASFADAAEASRRTLREAADRAAQELVDQLDDNDPSVRSLAARTILDRVGVPRTQRIEQVPGEVDTSMLTDEELTQYEAFQRKVHRVEP